MKRSRAMTTSSLRIMETSLWILFGILLMLGNYSANGQSDFEVEVELKTKKFVEKGSTLPLQCKHNIVLDLLNKVSWYKNSQKIFEFISGREPPFRNFSVSGSEIDFLKSNAHQLTLKGLDYDATGMYSCEVSLQSPIFSKESHETHVVVFLPQKTPPEIDFGKKQFYVGEKLVANCTTSRAKPVPHIVWMINGKKVDEIHTKILHPHNSLKNKLKAPHHDVNEYNELHEKENENKSAKEATGFNDYTEDQHRIASNHVARHHNSGGVENFESTDASYQQKSHNNFYKNKESNYPDNKNIDMHKKQRNGLINKKTRRHTNENTNQHQKHLPATRRKHPETYSSSQISIDVTDLHFDINGRLELTCVSTIPASVDFSEQYADFKTTSVKIDIEPAEPTTQLPQSAGMAALGNKSNKVFSLRYPLELLIQCLPMIIIALVNP